MKRVRLPGTVAFLAAGTALVLPVGAAAAAPTGAVGSSGAAGRTRGR
jgi:hypothetical protein